MGPGRPAAKHKNVISLTNMVKPLGLAMMRAAALRRQHRSSSAAKLLERIAWFNELRAAVEVGIGELDAGVGEELDIEELIGELNEEHAGRR
jgi:hypothetical protein